LLDPPAPPSGERHADAYRVTRAASPHRKFFSDTLPSTGKRTLTARLPSLLLFHRHRHRDWLQGIVEFVADGDLVEHVHSASLAEGQAALARTPDPVYNTALILLQEVAMSVRLNITMDDNVYARLKQKVSSKELSAFILGAVRAKLRPDARTLNAAYQAASKEQWRAGVVEDWKHID